MSAEFNFYLFHLRQVLAQVHVQNLLHPVGLDAQFSQASRSRRARSHTIAVARARSITSAFIFFSRT